MSDSQYPRFAPWLVAVFADMERLRPEIERVLIDAAAAVLQEKFETGPYWAGSVAKDVFDAMGKAFGASSKRAADL